MHKNNKTSGEPDHSLNMADILATATPSFTCRFVINIETTTSINKIQLFMHLLLFKYF